MQLFDIYERLYLSGQIDDWNAVKSITAIVSLQTERIDQPVIGEWINKAILWLPIHDTADYNASVDANWIKRNVELVESLWCSGHVILVHCAMGENRSGMLVTGLLMKLNKWTCEQALEFVRSKQPRAVWNEVWQKRLKEYEVLLKEAVSI